MNDQTLTYAEDESPTDAITAAQIRREELSAQIGADRYDLGLESMSKRDENMGSKPLRRILQNALPLTASYIEKEIAYQKVGLKNGQRIAELKLIENCGFMQCAYIGLNTTFGLWETRTYLEIAVRIADMVQTEAKYNGLAESDPKLYNRLFGDRVDPKRKSRNRTKMKAKDGSLDESSRLRIGALILDAIFYTDVFFLRKVWDHKKQASIPHIAMDEEVLEWLKDNNEMARWMRPIFSPMVVCPKPWKSTEETEGPYLLEKTNIRTPLVRRAFDPQMQKMLRDAGNEGTMREALDALNAIQSTPYRINTRVLEAVEWAWSLDLGGEVNKLPKASLVEEPERPKNYEDLPKEDQISWLRDRNAVRSVNDAVRTGVSSFSKDISEAKELSKFDRFWLPHNLDFRGRIYPIPHFNHQREDYVSAIIEFADGKPLGPRGAYWLAIHIVGCGEFDGAHKRKLEDRWQWVQSNSEQLCEYARDPYNNTGWMLAEKPFKFLAGCFEWAGYKGQTSETGNPSGTRFVSRLPIALDGSNSGLQHYAAALRSNGDALLVNLHDDSAPQDVYAAVAERVRDSVRQDAHGTPICDDREDISSQRMPPTGSSTSNPAKTWSNYGIDRKTVKRQVMTYGYSSEEYGFKDQLMADLMRPLTTQVLHGQLEEHPFGDYSSQFSAVNYLAKKIWDAIHEVVVSASEGMAWFKHVARLLAQEGKPVIWETPVGFPVLHRYGTYETKRIDVRIFDRKVDVSKATPKDKVNEEEGKVWKRHQFLMRTATTPKLNARKQKSAVAPNIIHSLDAAHLMRIVLHSLDEGIRDFSMIHDSFATHAGDTERFFWIIREAMVDMYEEYDIFQILYSTAWEQLSEEGRKKLLPPPAKGDFDIRTILRSTYSFC